MDQYTVKHEEEKKRFAIYDGEKEVGEITYTPKGDGWTIDHTFVDPSMEGKGLAGKLLGCLVDEARKKEVKLTPVCSYAVKKFQDNPEKYADVTK